MIWSMLRFDLTPGKMQDLREAFVRHQVLETSIQVEGCHILILSTPDPQGDTAYAMGLWDDEAAYQRWIDHPERGTSSDDLARLLASGERPTAPAELWPVLHLAIDPRMSPNGAGVKSTREEDK